MLTRTVWLPVTRLMLPIAHSICFCASAGGSWLSRTCSAACEPSSWPSATSLFNAACRQSASQRRGQRLGLGGNQLGLTA